MRRLPLLLLPTLLVVGACTVRADDGEAARAREDVITQAQQSVPLVARSLEADDVEAGVSWFECMQGLSWKYEGYALLTAPADSTEEQLATTLDALESAGYTDVTAVDDKISVEKDGYGLTLSPPPAGSQQRWKATFGSDCLPLSTADQRLVADEPEQPLDDLYP